MILFFTFYFCSFMCGTKKKNLISYYQHLFYVFYFLFINFFLFQSNRKKKKKTVKVFRQVQ